MSISQVSNPYSTGNGGATFENKVFASFISDLLIGGIIPNAPVGEIETIRFQARQMGYHTDDCLLIIRSTYNTHRVITQVKHGITFTNNNTFNQVIVAAWHDYCSPTMFNPEHDRIIIVSEPPAQLIVDHVRPLLYWAKQSQSAQEFIDKVNTPKFSSQQKKRYLSIFRTGLNLAQGADVSDEELWGFLKTLYISNYDFDESEGMALANVLTKLKMVMDPAQRETVEGMWARLVLFAAENNQAAGTVTMDSIDEGIRRCIRSTASMGLQTALQNLHACLAQVKPQIDHYITAFPSSMHEELESAMVAVYDRLAMSPPETITKWFFDSYHIPNLGSNFLEGLSRLWKMLTLLSVAYPNWDLVHSDLANLQLNSSEGTFRQLIYSTYQDPMPQVVLGLARRFRNGLNPNTFFHPLIMDNHRQSSRLSLCRRCGTTYQFGQILVNFCQDVSEGPFGEESNTYRHLEKVKVLCANCLFEEIEFVQTVEELKTVLREVIIGD